MSTDTIIRAAMDAGIALKFVDGKLKAVGQIDVVTAWAPRLRQHRAELIAALTTEPETEPVNPDAWRELHNTYMQHHLNCAVCKAAGKGYGLRCGAGAALWATYESGAAA